MTTTEWSGLPYGHAWLREEANSAVYGLLPTLRFVPVSERETALINLLERHQDPESRASAAVALGTFGQERRSILALEDARNHRSEPDRVRAAAARALHRRRP